MESYSRVSYIFRKMGVARGDTLTAAMANDIFARANMEFKIIPGEIVTQESLEKIIEASILAEIVTKEELELL